MPVHRADWSSRRDALQSTVQRVRKLPEEQRYEEARPVALRLVEECAALGVQSGQAFWLAAVTCDLTSYFEEAVRYAYAAAEADPAIPEYTRSVVVVMNHVRRVLSDPERAPSDPTTPTLYALLSQGEADAASHVQMARFLFETGDFSKAVRLLEAVTMCDPSCQEAFTLLGTALRSLGRVNEAVEAEARAVGLGSDPGPVVTMKWGRA